MTQTFEEMCAERDPLYAAMQPQRNMMLAVTMDRSAELWPDLASRCLEMRDSTLLRLAVRALRNQGQPYYDAR